MPKGIKDEEGRVIEVGDLVETKFRGGVHGGMVEAVIVNEQDLEEMGPDLGITIKNPPKVVYEAMNSTREGIIVPGLTAIHQHGHRVAHNPGTLSHVEPETDVVP